MKNISLPQLVALLISLTGYPAVAADLDLPASVTAPAATNTEPTGANLPEAMAPDLSSPSIESGPLLNVEQENADDAIARYAGQVHQLEIQNGAYSNDLVEQLLGLGSAYSDAGNYGEALKTYDRALHVNRVNQGLYNIDQIPILEKVIEANTRLGAYGLLTDKFIYLRWVYERNYGDNSSEMVPILNKIADWHLNAFTQTRVPESIGHLVIAANLFSEVIDLIKQTSGPDDPALIKPLYGIVDANFRLVEPYGYIRQDIDMIITGTPLPLLPNEFGTRPAFHNRSTMAINYDREYLNNVIRDEGNEYTMIQNSYRSGRAALEKIIDIHTKNPSLPHTSHAYALTLLGDWYQRFDKRDTALRYYLRAYQLLKDSGGDIIVLDDLFGRPLSLDMLNFEQMIQASLDRAFPHFVTSGQTDAFTAPANETAASLRETNFALTKFDVSAYGHVRNLEIIGSNQEDSTTFRRIAREKITTTPFRPRLENGKPIATKNVRMLYLFEE